MLRNYLQVAFRNFWQHKVFSVINVAGLAIGISASVIYLIVQHEYSWWVFGLTGAGKLFLATLVLSVRTVRSAMQNPVTSLRTE